MDYAASIADRAAPQGAGPFRNGAATGTPVAEFGSFEAINSYGQGSAGGTYTVRAGDTLASVALAAFGDANLWYLIAAANGLNGEAPLVEGQILTIPAGVVRSTHNASTFRPYDPARIIGDVLPNDVAPSPTTPQPQAARRRNRCGVFGAILLTVVAVAFTVYTAGAAVAALSPSITSITAGVTAVATASTTLSAGALIGIGAAAGAIGSIVSQGSASPPASRTASRSAASRSPRWPAGSAARSARAACSARRARSAASAARSRRARCAAWRAAR